MPDKQLPECRQTFSGQMGDIKQRWNQTIRVCYWDDHECEEARCRYNIQLSGDKDIIECYKELNEERQKED